MVAAKDCPTRLVHWPQAYRIVSSRYPPIDIFERVADEAEFETAFYIESLTNDRIRTEIGELNLVDKEDRVFGPGTGAIMAAFTHANPHGSRFSDGSYGVYYCAKELKTGVAETSFHLAQRLRLENEPPQERQMRVYAASLAAEMIELKSRKAHPDLLDPDDYGASREFGRQLKDMRAWGLIYPSLRRARGHCAGVFRPKALVNCVQAGHLAYHWDGESIETETLS